MIIGDDAVLIHYPWFEFWRDEIGAGRFPFWNPYTFSGFPAFATPQSGFAYPPHWIATPLPSALAINWMVGLHLMLAAVSTAWTASKLGANRDGQFLAGAVFALGGAFTARTVAGHLSFIEALAWLPLATGLAISIQERHRVWQLGLTVGLMTLAGQPEVTIFTGWWIPLWVVGIHFSRGRKELLLVLGRTAAGLLLGLGLAAYFLLPLLKMEAISNRTAGFTWDFRTDGSLPFWYLLETINPFTFGDPKDSTYWVGGAYLWHERLFYVGAITLLVAFFARGRAAVVCWLAVAAALLLAFGRYVPWYSLTTGLPGYEDMRIPGRHADLASLGLALAAGLGLKQLSGRNVAVPAIALAALLFILGLTATIWLGTFIDLLGGPDVPALRGVDLGLLTDSAQTPLVVAAILFALVAVFALLPAPMLRRGVLILAVLEIVFVLQPVRFEKVHTDATVESLRSSLPADSRRVVLQDAMASNYGVVFRAAQPGGYTSLFSIGYQELVSGHRSAGVAIEATDNNAPFYYFLGYDSILDRKKGSVTVFNPAPPRAWVAHCAAPGGAAEARADGFPLLSCVTDHDVTSAEPEAERTAATLTSEKPGHFEISAEGPGRLVTTTPFYPGWSAKVDGKDAAVKTYDGALVGVELPEGAHTVVFKYVPAGLTLGLLITALSGLAMGATWWWDHRAIQADTVRSGESGSSQ
jgi:hypothetical protein